MALISKPYTQSAGQTVSSSQYNSNLDTIYNDYNGNITNANISGSAAIVDTKLATISTAGKVSGAALTSLDLIPAGAGVIPSANLPTTSVTGKNLIVNGNFDIWQRGTSFVSAANGDYCADRFKLTLAGTAVVDLTRDTSVPTVGATAILSNYSLKLAVTTADASVAATDGVRIRTTIEGYDFAKLAQSAFTLSFWVRAHRTGTYCVSFRNSGSDRSYVAEYTINVADTWEKKTVTVSASPSAGTWDYTTGAGLIVTWSLMDGSNFQTTANSWQTGNYTATSNQVNGVAATSDTFYLSQIQVESGSSSTAFEFKFFSDDLARCQRYYWKSFSYGTAPAQNAGNAGALFYAVSNSGVVNGGRALIYPVPMRVSPTITSYNPGAANAKWRNTTDGADSGSLTASAPNEAGFHLVNPQVAGDGAGELCAIHITASAEF